MILRLRVLKLKARSMDIFQRIDSAQLNPGIDLSKDLSTEHFNRHKILLNGLLTALN